MPKRVHLKQRTLDWLQWRRNRITASMTASIMGLNPHCTPLALYERIISEEPLEVNEHMQYGIDHENEAREWLSKTLNIHFEEECFEHDDKPWLAASLDAYSPFVIAEIKCMGPKNHEKVDLVGCLPEHYPQCQHQLYVMDMERMYYLAYRHDMAPHLKEVKRDDKFIEKMIPALEDFYYRVLNFIPPDPTDKDLIERSDPSLMEIAKALDSVNLNMKQLENQKEELRKALIKGCEGRSSKIGDYRFVRSVRPGAVEYSKIPELQGVDLTAYRKSSVETWRFS